MSKNIGATELELFIDNDGDLYRQQTTSILKNLATKKARGEYDSAKAQKLFMHLMEAGAKKYARHFPGTPWNIMFPIEDRRECAKRFEQAFQAQWKEGSYRDLLPKKYQGKA